ncbi:MAG: SDR family oxidoreductase [Chloroflexi bacterium]|nr:MAG: SDR family oxidoreductase [Chloroflexota bacterium]
MWKNNRRVLVTGGGTFLGDYIAAALLAEGADVSMLVRPGNEEHLGALGQRVRWWVADVWDPASLRGRGRGQSVVVHTVGSLVANPQQGLTHHRLNFLSARNVANMCITDGVPRMVLMSSARAPWISGAYIKAKREAETYMARVGLDGYTVRAPITYLRGQKRPLLYRIVSALGNTPIISWLGFRRIAPLPIDIIARGVARIALEPQPHKRVYYAGDLVRLNTRDERRNVPAPVPHTNGQPYQVAHPFQLLDDDAPFAWLPPDSEENT